jgi:hypothetical protein
MGKIAKKARPNAKVLVISKNRKPAAPRIKGHEAKSEFIGRLKGIVRIVGDIESPVVPPEAWEYD